MTRAAAQFDATTHFDEGAATRYERRIRAFCPSYDALHRIAAAWVRDLPEGARFLSCGAGTGGEILALGAIHPSWRFVAVDISRDMLSACRARVVAAGMEDRVSFSEGRAEDFRSPAPFDGASSVFVAHFIEGHEAKLAYFRAIRANLKPGATFILADLFGEPAAPAFRRSLDAWLACYAASGVVAQDLARDRAHIENDISFIPEAELRELLEEAGFEAPIRFFQTFLFGGWAATKRR